jgi:hypothetical protein
LPRRWSSGLDDAIACLAEVNEPDVRAEREATWAAIDALRDGHASSAQALAASVFTSLIHVWFEIGKTRKIRKLMAERSTPEDAGISELRLRTIYLAGAKALEQFRPDRAWPRYESFKSP